MPSLPGYILTMTSSVVLLTLVHLTRAANIMGHYSDTQEYNNSSNNPTSSKSSTSGANPTFVSTEIAVTVAPSQMAILPCSVKFLGERQVVWRKVKEDEFLTIGKMVWSKDPRVLVEYRVKEQGVTSWDLLLRNVQYNDAGVYECQVTSSEKIVWNVELKVIDPVTSKPKSRVHKQVTETPHVTETKQTMDHQRPAWKKQTTSLDGFRHRIPDDQRTPHSEELLTAGRPVRLMCNISLVNHSLPRATNIEWYKDGESLESNTQVLLTRYQLEHEQMYISELTIDKSRLADSGDYLCRYMNSDLFLFKVYVLPNTTINSANKEDQSQYYAVETLQKGNSAVSSYHLSCSWSLAFLYLIHALLVINQLAVFVFKNGVSCFVKVSTNVTQVDPT